jgi:hypothetical protein
MAAANVFGAGVATLGAVPLVARPRAPGRSRQADVFRNEILSLLARRRFCICLRAPFLSATGAVSSSAHRLPRFAVRVLPSKRSSGKGNQSSAASNPSFRLQAVEHPVRSGKSCTALLECARNPFHRTKNRRKQKRIARRSTATIRAHYGNRVVTRDFRQRCSRLSYLYSQSSSP